MTQLVSSSSDFCLFHQAPPQTGNPFSSALREAPQQTHLGPGSWPPAAGVHSPGETVCQAAGQALGTELQGQARGPLQSQVRKLGTRSQALAPQSPGVAALGTSAPWQGWLAGRRGASAELHGDSGGKEQSQRLARLSCHLEQFAGGDSIIYYTLLCTDTLSLRDRTTSYQTRKGQRCQNTPASWKSERVLSRAEEKTSSKAAWGGALTPGPKPPRAAAGCRALCVPRVLHPHPHGLAME